MLEGKLYQPPSEMANGPTMSESIGLREEAADLKDKIMGRHKTAPTPITTVK